MFSFFKLPARIIGILEANISPREIAFGVCLGMFFGFTPLNGTTAFLLAICFFVFKVNRMATVLTLPVFKTLYILGMSKMADGLGTYLLEKADYLYGFWRIITNLPIIAYVDINRTTVAGGLVLSALLSIPVYFISKRLSAVILARYKEKMQETAFSKWIKKIYHTSNIIGPDAASIIGNVKATVKNKLISKIKSAVIKPKTAKSGPGIMKRINLGGIAVIMAVLLVIHVGVGLVISPAAGSLIVDAVNKASSAKITIEKIKIWPLTLSFSMKNLKVFDPKDTDKRIAKADNVSVRISPIGLLSKRIIFSGVKLSGTEIDIEGRSDGTFNVQGLAKSEKAKETSPGFEGLWKITSGKHDWFGRIYSAVKKRFSKKGQSDAKSARKVTAVTENLPKGKFVKFRAPEDSYLFEIKDMDINGRIKLVPENDRPIEIDNAKIGLSRVAFDPENGARLDGMDLRGKLSRDGTGVGAVKLFFSKSYGRAGQRAVCKIGLEDVDLDAVRFIYEDSLPVRVAKGKVSLSSSTKIEGESIDSRNSLTLTEQFLEPKQGGASIVGFIPMPAVCNALNSIDPVRLKFDITGTVERPEFGGFQESLLNLIKPYVANIGEQVKSKGMSMLGDILKKNTASEAPQDTQAGSSDTADKAAEAIKSLFGDKK